MEKQETFFNEAKLASMLREELYKTFQENVEQEEVEDLSNFELISKNEQKPYVSPIFTMSEDEILNFVEEFDVNELATLSTEELNHIGKVLGVEPKILIEGMG